MLQAKLDAKYPHIFTSINFAARLFELLKKCALINIKHKNTLSTYHVFCVFIAMVRKARKSECKPALINEEILWSLCYLLNTWHGPL